MISTLTVLAASQKGVAPAKLPAPPNARSAPGRPDAPAAAARGFAPSTSVITPLPAPPAGPKSGGRAPAPPPFGPGPGRQRGGGGAPHVLRHRGVQCGETGTGGVGIRA